MKKGVVLAMLLFVCLSLFAESVIMVFPQDDDAVILFDDHSWYYHSEISWYDSVDFLHYNSANQFAILEEKSWLSADGSIIIKGVAMNTSMDVKKCVVAYAALDSEKNRLATGTSQTEESINPGNLFPFTIEIKDINNAKYISFDYIMEVE